VGLHAVRLYVGLTAEEAGMSEQKLCGECRKELAIIMDLDIEPGAPWCLDCALVLVKVGDPIVNYRELDGGAMYTTTLGNRGTTQTLRFR
jgi:hypothetical protein